MFKVKKESTEKIYTVFAVQKDKFGGTEFLIYDDMGLCMAISDRLCTSGGVNEQTTI